MAGWFDLNKSSNSQYYFVLKTESGETILMSERYQTKTSAEHGISSVQTNSPLDERYEKKVSGNGKFYFNLKAANHQIIATSPMYSSISARDGAILSGKENGTSVTVKDHT